MSDSPSLLQRRLPHGLLGLSLGQRLAIAAVLVALLWGAVAWAL